MYSKIDFLKRQEENSKAKEIELEKYIPPLETAIDECLREGVTAIKIELLGLYNHKIILDNFDFFYNKIKLKYHNVGGWQVDELMMIDSSSFYPFPNALRNRIGFRFS